MRLFADRKHFARNCADSSLMVKYQCPDECALKFEISPSTQTDAKRASIALRTDSVSSLTVRGLRSTSSNRELKSGWLIRYKDLRAVGFCFVVSFLTSS